jgi:hypothetical protein
MYIKNRRISNKIKGFGSDQTLYLTESMVLRNVSVLRTTPLLLPPPGQQLLQPFD